MIRRGFGLIAVAAAALLTSRAPAAPPAAPTAATVTLDLTHRLSIGGVIRLDRGQYFNVHAGPVADLAATWPELARDRITFGRRIGWLSSILAHLQPDPANPAAVDPARLATRLIDPNIRELRPDDQLIITVKPQAYFPHTGRDTGYFPPTDADAARTIVALLRHEWPAGIRPPLLEVANEPFVHLAEWKIPVERIISLHRAVAQQVHHDLPGVLVGGPTLAWPEFEHGDFKTWNQWMGRFIQEAAPDLDFLSLHLYSTDHDDHMVRRNAANVDAILDLIETAARNRVGHPAPLVVSEYGTLIAKKGEAPYSRAHDWAILQGVNSTLFCLLDRPDRVIRSIPFLLPDATWKHGAPFAYLLYHGTGKDRTPTDLMKFYDLWKDVDGDRFVADSGTPAVLARLYVDHRTAWLALNNQTDRRLTVNLRPALPTGVEIAAIRRVRLRPVKGVASLEDVTLAAGARRVGLAPEETTLLRLALTAEPSAAVTCDRRTAAAKKTLVPIGNKPLEFQIASPAPGSTAIDAKLAIDFARPHRLSLRPTVTFNGAALAAPAWIDPQTARHEFFGSVELTVPPRLLRDRNVVRITFPGTGGRVATVVLRVTAPSHT